jgi:hypothetical protein
MTIDAYDSGWILLEEFHITTNESYAAGFSDSNGRDYRNFLCFDLTGVSDTVRVGTRW